MKEWLYGKRIDTPNFQPGAFPTKKNVQMTHALPSRYDRYKPFIVGAAIAGLGILTSFMEDEPRMNVQTEQLAIETQQDTLTQIVQKDF